MTCFCSCCGSDPLAGSSFCDVKAEGVHEGRPTVSPLQAPGLQMTRIHSKSQGQAPRQGQEGPAPWKRRAGLSGQLIHLSLSQQSHSPKTAALSHIVYHATHSFLCDPGG